MALTSPDELAQCLLKPMAMSAAVDFSYEWLNRPDVRQQYMPDNKSIHLYIDNVRCGGCLSKLEKLVYAHPEITDFRYNMSNHVGEIEFIDSHSLLELVRELHSGGFPSRPIPRNIDSEKYQKAEHKRDLKQIGVAAFSAGNIMLFSTAIYLGAEQFEKLFHWLSFLLLIPSLIYSAGPLFHSATRSLIRKEASMDLPIVMAIAVGSLLSMANLFSGSSHIYFDSISVLIFLILVSRKVLKSWHQQHFLNDRLNRFLFISKPERWDQNQWLPVSIDEIQKGDKIRLQKNDIVPIDGEILTESRFDFSVISGESLPKLLRVGGRVYAGAKVQSETVDILVTSGHKETRLGKLLKSVEKKQRDKTPVQLKIDQASYWFTTAIVFGAVLGLVFLSVFVPFEESMSRILALTMVACPCALAFVAPFIYSTALSRLSGLGFIIKSPGIIEKLESIQSVWFDKTGTLTEAQLQVLDFPVEKLTKDQREAIVAIEQNSEHPVAEFLLSQMNTRTSKKVENFQYIPGFGVSGEVGDHFYQIFGIEQSASDSMNDSNLLQTIQVNENGLELIKIKLLDRIKFGAKDLVTKLKRNFHVGLISGDHEASVKRVAKALNLSEFLSRQSPEQKLQRIDSSSLFVGDGVNDTAAMSAAGVSVAVHGSAESCLKISDAYLVKNDLSAILGLIKVSSRARRALRVVLTASAVYNFVCAVLALMGWINPLVAAILMPTSTITLLTLATLLQGGSVWKY